MNSPSRSMCIRLLRYQQAAYDQGLIDSPPLDLRTVARMTVTEVAALQTRLEKTLQQDLW